MGVDELFQRVVEDCGVSVPVGMEYEAQMLRGVFGVGVWGGGRGCVCMWGVHLYVGDVFFC